MVRFLTFALLTVMALVSITEAATRSVVAKHVTYVFKKKNSTEFRAIINTESTRTWLDSNATHPDWIDYLYESSFAPFTNITMKKNKKLLGSKYHNVDRDWGPDLFLTDDNIHELWYPDRPKWGDKFSYSTSQSVADMSYIPWVVISNEDSLSEFTFTVDAPIELSYKLHVFFPREQIPYTTETLDSRRTLYRFPPMKRKPELPQRAFNYCHAIIIVEVINQGEVISATTPRGITKWFGRMASLDPVIDTATAAFLLDSIAPLPTVREKLRALHDWVRKNIRYLQDYRGKHGFQPHFPDTVLSRGYGDCKDRAYLICALAKALGIPVFMGLVSVDPVPDMDLIYPSIYDHVICYYEDSTQSFFFDATAKYHPFEDYPDCIVEQRALILDPKNPRELTVPRHDSLPMISAMIDGHIDSVSTVNATITIRGDLLAAYRAFQVEQMRISAEDFFDKMISAVIPPIHFHHYKIIDDQPREITLQASADLSRWMVASGTARYLPQTLFVVTNNEILKREQDTLPIVFDTLADLRASITLRGAKSAKPVDSLQLGEIGTGQSISRFSAGENSVTCSYQFHRRQKFLYGEARSAYLSFCRQYFAAKKQVFTLAGG